MHIDSDMLQDLRHAWWVTTVLLGFAVEIAVVINVFRAVFKTFFKKPKSAAELSAHFAKNKLPPLGPGAGTSV